MKAVVFVDVQKDFIDGALKNEQAIAVTPKIVEFAKDCVVDDNCKLYATRDTHQKTVYADIHELNGDLNKNVPWNGYLATLEGKKLPVEHCIEGTEGWEIDKNLEVLDSKVVCKPNFGWLGWKDLGVDFANMDIELIDEIDRSLIPVKTTRLNRDNLKTILSTPMI